MRVRVISDLHGAVEHIPAAAAGCDRLVVLGDLINVLDYRTMDGILVDIFGREPVAQAASLRSQGKFQEARETIRRHAPEGLDIRARMAELASEQYREVFGALPEGTIVTFGNVDIPDLGSLAEGFAPHSAFPRSSTTRSTPSGWRRSATSTSSVRTIRLGSHGSATTPSRGSSSRGTRRSSGISRSTSPGTPCSGTCTTHSHRVG